MMYRRSKRLLNLERFLNSCSVKIQVQSLYVFLFLFPDLSKNRFSELPEEVTGFHFLEKLHCYHNAIRFIPDTISTLQCLSFLDLSRNQLTNLPREICQLPIQVGKCSSSDLISFICPLLPTDTHNVYLLRLNQ